MKYVIVTGGSGFIGSAVVNDLLTYGYDVLVVDRKINHWTELLFKSCPSFRYIQSDVCDLDMHEVMSAIGSYDIHAVIHLAANHVLPESVSNPLKFYKNNLNSLINVIDIFGRYVHKTKKPHIIYSSSAAVYGKKFFPLSETDALEPQSPYGQTKLWGENILAASSFAYGFQYACLRYFNVAGSGLRHGYNAEVATHAVPILIRSILNNKKFTIYGNDYPTQDGTCVRDYLHVRDVSSAHVLALKYLENKQESLTVNIGTGDGTSMIELIDSAKRVLNKDVDYEMGLRRLGDPAFLVADPRKAEELLGWKQNYTLDDIIRDSWEWETERGN